MTVLYQKYRPQNFSEIFGQNNIKTTLQNEILYNQISHAYLFCGPRAVGKTTMARVLAKSLNCKKREKNQYEPCNECDACLSINNFNNLDVIEIDAASNTGVDNVRENIIALSRFISTNNKYKIFIIDEVHMLSLSAFNALLKTLEEPPKNVIFILCATEAYKVPATIISRCQRFDFKKISSNDMVSKLELIVKKEDIKVDREVLELISSKADGHLRDAESLLSQIISVSGKKINLASANLVIPYNNLEENIIFLEHLSKKDTTSSIELINKLFFNGVSLNIFVSDLIELLRKMILSKISSSLSTNLGLDLSEKIEIKINELSSRFEISDLICLSRGFMEDAKELSSHFIPQMPLELRIVSFCTPDKDNKFSSLKNQVNNQEKTKKEVVENNSIESNVVEKISNKEKENNSSMDSKDNSNDLDLISNLWPEFLIKLKKYNHSLSFVMQSCQIKSFKEKKICLSFRYKLHKDRLDNAETRDIINKTLEEVYKDNISIEAYIDENSVTDIKKPSDETIDNILKTFGGQIINS